MSPEQHTRGTKPLPVRPNHRPALARVPDPQTPWYNGRAGIVPFERGVERREREEGGGGWGGRESCPYMGAFLLCLPQGDLSCRDAEPSLVSKETNIQRLGFRV
jgi:hypothetical protein